MPTKKKAAKEKATPRKTGLTVAKIGGRPVRIDGHDYEIVALHKERNVFEFARPEGAEAGETKFRRGLGNISDITEAEEGFLYLPNRITPKLEDVIQSAIARGEITPAQAPDITAAVRNHPVYTDRDDIALQQVGEMYGIDLIGAED